MERTQALSGLVRKHYTKYAQSERGRFRTSFIGQGSGSRKVEVNWFLTGGGRTRGVHYKVLALEEIFKNGFPSNIIGRRHQEIYLKLEEKFGRKYPGPKVGRMLEENML